MVSGTDMHGTPITLAAEKEGVEPGELAERYHREIKDTLERVGVSYDLYTKTSTVEHVETAQQFFSRLRREGYIYEDAMLLPYCPEHGEYLPDRYVEGTCPRCGFEDARGDQCDECGLTLDAEELENPRCALDGAEPEFRERQHYFFKLSAFQDDLEDWVAGMEEKWRPNVYGQTTTWLNEGLEDRPISRDMEYGVPIPGDDRVLYVWFEAVMGYLSATKKYFADAGDSEDWREYWEGEDAEIYYFIAKDNIPFHTILWPAMLMGHGDLNLPTDVPANEYLNLEGAQFSTSRGHAIWVNDFLKEFHPDQVRYVVASIMPERRDSNFKLDDFQRLVNDELIATYGNFVHRVLTMIHTEWGEIPEPGEFDERDEQFLEGGETRNQIKVVCGGLGITGEIEEKQFREGLETVMVLARRGNRYLNQQQPWKQKGTQKKTTLYVAANIVKALAVVSEPFLPHSARKIWTQLGLEGEPERWEQAIEPLESGTESETTIPKPEPLFDKVEDEDLEPWSAIEESSSEEFEEKTDEKNDEVEEDMDRISFDEFQKLDVRIGEVLEAEPVEGSDKLLKLLVDIGEEERQVVAGVKEQYAPEELVGTEVVILVNLEPATIFGVESDGMLLAAGDGYLLRPDRNVDIGSRVA